MARLSLPKIGAPPQRMGTDGPARDLDFPFLDAAHYASTTETMSSAASFMSLFAESRYGKHRYSPQEACKYGEICL